MRKILVKCYYLINNLKYNLFNRKVKVSLSSRIKPRSELKGYNKIGAKSYLDGELGYCSYIGDNSIISAKIGNYCSIGSNVTTVIAVHPTSFVSTSPIFYSKRNQTGFEIKSKKLAYDELLQVKHKGAHFGVVIGNDVWIGDRVLIKGGIKVGNGAVIAMGSVVTKDVEPYSIVGGVPAKHIKFRFQEETVHQLNKTKWWEKAPAEISKYASFMGSSEMFLKEWDK